MIATAIFFIVTDQNMHTDLLRKKEVMTFTKNPGTIFYNFEFHFISEINAY